ncbi:MAG: class I SAM-dependent methyltransferase [Paracoccaceae bacterium]
MGKHSVMISEPTIYPTPDNLAKDRQLAEGWEGMIGALSAFRGSLVLISACELGFFTNSDAWEPIKAIAKRCEISEVAARQLANVVAKLEFGERSKDQFRLRPEIAVLFEAGSGRDVSHNVKAFRTEVDAWLRMSDIMRGRADRPEEYSCELYFGEILKFEGITMLNRVDAEELIPAAKQFVKSGFDVLDLGGGDGYYAHRLCQIYDDITVDIVDIENGFVPSERLNQDFLKQKKIRHIEHDARGYKGNTEYDVVFLNELMELFNEDDKLAILQTAVDNMKPGGHLIITKFPMDSSGTSPGNFPLFSMRMFMKFEDAYLESEGALIEWAQTMGLKLVKHFSGARVLLAFTKPKGGSS